MASARLDRAYSIADLRLIARRRLPRPVFDYIDGGADDEITLRRNALAFDELDIIPDVLTDVSVITTAGKVLGRELAWPLILSPTGMNQLFHQSAEPAVARAAGRAGLGYSLSTVASTRLEALADHDGPKVFQIYIFKDRGLTRELVARCRETGFDALMLTVDTPVAGNRRRDHANGLSVPPKLTLRSFASFARHPAWSLPALWGPKFDFVNVSDHTDGFATGPRSIFQYINEQFDRSLVWRDVEWLAAEWGGPLAVKGIMTPADARRAAAAGASAVMLSNHGGRQLDGAPAPLEQVAEVRNALGDATEIICDGGIRRGSDVVKALAVGATACSTGRSYLWGLAAGGEAGVDRALTILQQEFVSTMALAGVNDVAKLSSRNVRWRNSNHASTIAYSRSITNNPVSTARLALTG